jgi:hypothetical protein
LGGLTHGRRAEPPKRPDTVFEPLSHLRDRREMRQGTRGARVAPARARPSCAGIV